jgi:predicted CXXCH cytochrome family protein
LIVIATVTNAASPVGQPNVSSTRHNLSSTGTPGGITAQTENEVCVFCHTPHGSNAFPGSPLWNRSLSSEMYDEYTSESLDTEDLDGALAEPAGSSRLCLSCHDGTLAISTVGVLNGQTGGVTIPMNVGLDAGDTMPGDPTSGNTRDLGFDLTNDHPISFTFDSDLFNADGELFNPAVTARIGIRTSGNTPQLPLEATGPGGDEQVQCASCHDPHLEGTDQGMSLKFLRGHRFQSGLPVQGAYSPGADQICLGCHDKDGWATSAHASQGTANETYKTTPAGDREFPDALPVWQAGCLNCHDAHTVHGARRLLREGIDASSDPALEETCFQCHTSSAASIINDLGGEVPDIETEFGLAVSMPLTTTDQAATFEEHRVEDADLVEPVLQLGKGDLTNRHAECTDCHNPHRLIRNSLYNGSGDPAQRTHPHGTGHTNEASGALRGSWGVDPNYGGASFGSLPSSYSVVSGDPSTAINPLTKEFQLCLKCHSDFAYNDTGAFPTGGRPRLGDSLGGTFPGTNNLNEYTNQAMEFQAPAGDRGAPGGNHRSWHPVVDSTGRTPGIRTMGNSGNMFRTPWGGGGDVGSQTMLCSDCHGRATGNTTVAPPAGFPWGPHGSENDFLLKGTWDSNTGSNNSGLCFRCHNFQAYATETHEGDDNNWESGFGGNKDTNLHAFHRKRIGKNLRCTWCHVAIPHGWKNKALLVNLNDVGSEAGVAGVDFTAVNGEVAINGNGQTFNAEPYYMNAKLKVRNWRASGTWRDTDCGSEGSNNNSNDTQTGKDWMGAVCSNPP